MLHTLRGKWRDSLYLPVGSQKSTDALLRTDVCHKTDIRTYMPYHSALV